MAERARVATLRIETEDRDRRRVAESLARRLGLRMIADAGSDACGDFTLAMRDDGLELRSAMPRMKPGTGLSIDFHWLRHRRANLTRQQPLAKAVGRDTRTVLDATAGLGQDAALLAAMGFKVTAVERHPILAAILDAALRDAAIDPVIATRLGGRLAFVHQDARVMLAAGSRQFDCVYLDPMFPPKRKASALARKEIRLVRALVGDDDDAGELLALARAHARRAVVKRPAHAPPLAEDVTGSIAGKLARYDLYVRADRPPTKDETRNGCR
jgi:16S rRNA (guanine1516-N2)-methyltransferase